MKKIAQNKNKQTSEWIFPGIVGLLLCSVIGISVAMKNVPGMVWAVWCQKCHENDDKWLGRNTKYVVSKLGTPTTTEPTDDEMRNGASCTSGGVPIQEWHYDRHQIRFTVQLPEKTVISVKGYDHHHLSDGVCF